jgi:S-adenosyl-L-methionine hydrolase (adenosine-forming)
LIVSLLSDFGVADTYVGQMKAALLSIAPAVSVVDITHAVPPQDVFAGAFLLWTAVPSFPPGSVHLAIVDPGVGSTRPAIAARAARGDTLVGPDNGLLVPALSALGGCTEAVELRNTRYWRRHVSGTFHGRDVFAPVAGHLALGVSLAELGPPVQLAQPFRLELADGLRGQILYVDGYGNLISNMPAEKLPERFCVSIRGHRVASQPFYAAAQPGELLALVGSSGLLEISVRDGSAAELLKARRGDAVEVAPL